MSCKKALLKRGAGEKKISPALPAAFYALSVLSCSLCALLLSLCSPTPSALSCSLCALLFLLLSYLKDRLRAVFFLPLPAGRQAFSEPSAEKKRSRQKLPCYLRLGSRAVWLAACFARIASMRFASALWLQGVPLLFPLYDSMPRLCLHIRVQHEVCITANKCVSSRCGLLMLQNLCENILTNACFCATRVRARARPRYNKGAQVGEFPLFRDFE